MIDKERLKSYLKNIFRRLAYRTEVNSSDVMSDDIALLHIKIDKQIDKYQALYRAISNYFRAEQQIENYEEDHMFCDMSDSKFDECRTKFEQFKEDLKIAKIGMEQAMNELHTFSEKDFKKEISSFSKMAEQWPVSFTDEQVGQLKPGKITMSIYSPRDTHCMHEFDFDKED